MEKRGLPPGMKETIERVAVALWFAGILVLLYLTLQSQLARAAQIRATPVSEANGVVRAASCASIAASDGLERTSGA